MERKGLWDVFLGNRIFRVLRHFGWTKRNQQERKPNMSSTQTRVNPTVPKKWEVGPNKAQKMVMFGFLRIRICFKQLRNWIQDHNWLNKPLGANTVSTKLGTQSGGKKHKE